MKNIFAAILCAGLLAACHQEDAVTPSNLEHNRLEDIVDLSYPLVRECHDKYGSYILYQFDSLADFAYLFEQAGSWRSAEVQKLDKADVQGALDYLQQEFMSYYPEEMKNSDGVLVETRFREKYLPLKFLICKEIIGGTLGITSVPGGTRDYHDATANMNCFAVSRLDAVSLADMPPQRARQFRNNIHYMFLAGYLSNAKHVELANAAFYDVSRMFYGTAVPVNSRDEDYYNRGFIVANNLTTFPSAGVDLREYLNVLINMEESQVNQLRSYVLIKVKATHLVKSLTDLGVDILALNPSIKLLIQ